MYHRALRPLPALPLALGILLPVTATAFEAPLLGDAYLSTTLPNNNLGTVATLNVGNGSRGLLKFDLSGLPAEVGAEQVAKATLRLWVNRISAAGDIQVLEAASDWGETTVTHHSAPSTGLLAGTFKADSAGRWVTLDLTATVKAWLSGAVANRGLLLEPSPGASTVAFFDTKENTGTSHPAQLDIVLAGPQGAQGDPGPAGPEGPAGAQGPAGAAGLAGPQGPAGPEGPAGLPGKALLNGVGAPLANLGEDGDFYLDTAGTLLYGPKTLGAWPSGVPLKGLNGDVGATGPQGPQGDAGPTGPKGPQGDTGPTGPKGPQGDTGPAGPQGLQGDSGATGPQGLKGNTGATGPQGLPGAVGPQGSAGPQGGTGSQGPAGSTGPQGAQGPQGPAGPAGPAGGTGPVGPTPHYAYTLVVGKFANDGTGRSLVPPSYVTVTAALNAIPSNLYNGGVCSAHYLVKVLPGTYSESVAMKPCVDIEGSGELDTAIESNAAITLTGANEAELRFLTVRNTRAGGIAISNDAASPRLSHITVTATAATGVNVGILDQNNASPVLSQATVKASSAGNSFGIDHKTGSILVQHSLIEAGSQGISAGQGTAQVVASQVKGGTGGTGAVCAASYDDAYAALGADCKTDMPPWIDFVVKASSSVSTYADKNTARWPGGATPQSAYGYTVQINLPSGDVDGRNFHSGISGWSLGADSFPGQCVFVYADSPDCTGLGGEPSTNTLPAPAVPQITPIAGKRNWPSCTSAKREWPGQARATAIALFRCYLK